MESSSSDSPLHDSSRNSSPLLLDERVNRWLVSTPAPIVGEFTSEDMYVTHCWPNPYSMGADRFKLSSGPTHRRYFVISLAIDPPVEKTIVLPNYDWLGGFYASLLSVFYGKRFDYHGMLETRGRFQLPTTSPVELEPLYRLAPYSEAPRKDGYAPLNLVEIEPLVSVLTLHGSIPDRAFDVFRTASGFYNRALSGFAERPEVAYLDLVTAGEVVSQYYSFDDADLFPPEMLSVLSEIEATLGKSKARLLRKQMLQVRKRFWLAIRKLIPEQFFDHSEAADDWGQFKSESFQRNVLAAYDLRSFYVHAGELFGNWTRAFGDNHDVQLGEPVLDDKALKKVLTDSPTFIGMERVIRTCLLSFLHNEICPFNSELDCRPSGVVTE